MSSRNNKVSDTEHEAFLRERIAHCETTNDMKGLDYWRTSLRDFLSVKDLDLEEMCNDLIRIVNSQQS